MSQQREPSMENPKAKRRKLSHSSEDSLGATFEDGDSSGSSSEPSLSVGQTNGHSQSEGTRSTSSKLSRNGHVKSMRHSSTSKLSSQRLMAANTAGSSSMMTLQINDLLGEIRPDYDKLMSGLEETVRRLQMIILDLPDVAPMTAPEAEKLLRKEAGVCVPFPHPRPGRDTKYTLEYKRPARVDVVGSLPLQLGIKSKDICTADLAITLPDSIVQEKDFLNHRYFHKRAYYIAQVAAGIRGHAKKEFNFSFEHQDGITWKPSLVIEPNDSSPPGFTKSKLRVRIICAISADVFPGNKTLPTKCCLRTSDSTSPTPYYNACLRSDAITELYHRLLERTSTSCEAFRDVCRLGRLWLRQRGFGGCVTRGGFGPFEWSIVCALLLQSGGSNGRPALSPRYSCLQLFKAILQFLAAKDLTDPLLLNGATCEIPKSDAPVLFDGAGQINLLFKMTCWSYQLLRQEARATIEAFSSKAVDIFESIFVKRLDQDLLRFDQCLFLEARAFLQVQHEHENAQEGLQMLHSVLSRALSNRARLVHLRYDDTLKWSIDKSLKQGTKVDKRIEIGLLLDPDHVDRLVDHGPSAEDKAAAADFREFWGDKAELRRFKDGSITESLVWSEESPVTPQITSYILQRHFEIPSSAINFLGDQVEHVVLAPNRLLSRKSAFKVVNDAFQSLTTQLRQLEGLPLSIRSILPASSQLRYASDFTPLASTPLHPIDIIIEFEGSARWPDSLPAIQRTKIAFLIKLGDLLSASDSMITTCVGLENTTGPASSYSNTSFLDIYIPSPQAHLLQPIPFRLRIHHDRTLTLLQKALSSSTKPPNRTALTSTLQSTTRHYLSTPTHTTPVSRLCTLHPSLPRTIHLLKLWTASHHLTHSLPEEILEIFAARPYVHPYPYVSAPASPQTAFLRILSFVANWDWTAEPLIIDLNASSNPYHNNPSETEGGGGLTREAIAKAQTRFTAWPPPAALPTPPSLDPTGVVWTQGARPPRVVAARFTALARASIELVRSRHGGLDMQADDWRGLFVSPLTDFDFVIHLKKNVVGSGHAETAGGGGGGGGGGAAPTKFKNLQIDRYSSRYDADADDADDEVMRKKTLCLDPIALFLQDLQRCLGDRILFFHGAQGSRLVPALWNPKVLPLPATDDGKRMSQQWRVGMAYSTIPVLNAAASGGGGGMGQGPEAGEVEVEGLINQRGILAEIALLGVGLVERIEVLKDLVR
ncbi:hypothetical protein EPUS_07423 [Endocarpon pusillum Z07020]|uniref:U3 small nucleolar RNA-associated protein 22 n=1 Tax=Endocarpon pusillum (strain Z07020 / HMAS-L-300199) TaxID=1263415 RepID=U1HM72_ENDPU|nr:uncharacterized protein EPUS_07423 [Endocarpon pusillum Z07020]ERF71395.1 hypothetical protein EPUS_07423 [Endocarpon pusillum Z07020]